MYKMIKILIKKSPSPDVFLLLIPTTKKDVLDSQHFMCQENMICKVISPHGEVELVRKINNQLYKVYYIDNPFYRKV